jgi:hypothetical protein
MIIHMSVLEGFVLSHNILQQLLMEKSQSYISHQKRHSQWQLLACLLTQLLPGLEKYAPPLTTTKLTDTGYEFGSKCMCD